GPMPKTVVDNFEIVQVDEQHAYPGTGSRGILQLPIEAFDKRSAVCKLSQRILTRLALQVCGKACALEGKCNLRAERRQSSRVFGRQWRGRLGHEQSHKLVAN